MKILIIRNAYRYDFGGGERFPVLLAAELNNRGYQATVISRSPKLLEAAQDCHMQYIHGWWWPQQNWSGRRIVFVPIYFLWLMLLTAWYVQLIIRLRPDVIHPQSKDDFVAATVAGRLMGKRIVWTDHADLKYILANHQIWYKNPVGKLVYACSRLASAVTLVSQSEQSLIAAQLGHVVPNNYLVVHNGINDTPVKPRPRRAEERGKFIFCATSRLVTAKGIGELIDAFTALHARYPDTLLWLIGGGPEEQKFTAQTKGQTAIVFFGHSDQPLSYVASCDVFVHPSYHEGFSLSLIEAAMLAKPIIACAVGGNTEIVYNRQTGLLVEARDTAGLKDAMERLYRDKTLADNLGKAARTLYEKEFRFDKLVTEQFIPLYEK